MVRRMIDNNLMRFQQFIKDREEALWSLDKEKIMAFADKYHIPMPENELAFMAGVHKEIFNMTNTPDDVKKASALWLTEHGFRTEIWGG